jgi:hypothetical protein
MTEESDIEFDTLLRSLAVPLDEVAQQAALKEKIKARVAAAFHENGTVKTKQIRPKRSRRKIYPQLSCTESKTAYDRNSHREFAEYESIGNI